MNDKARDVKNAETLLLALSGDIQLRESRIRKAGTWCFFCADDHSLARCGCAMPEGLGCHGKRVCSDCATAHRAIAGHLRKMFAAPIVDRSSSVRAKLFSQLHGAADELDEKNGVPMDDSLHLHLADACPFDDERGEFKGKILHAFERSKFADFQGLAKELARETDDELKLKVARWFSCIR
jgi:hypothetical protein